MDEIETPKTSLMDTKLEDMTVGDYAKLNAYAVGFTAVGVAVFIAGATAYDKFAVWNFHRKTRKFVKDNTPTEE